MTEWRALHVNLVRGETGLQDKVFIKLADSETQVACDIVQETHDRIVVSFPSGASCPSVGDVVAMVHDFHSSLKSRSGTVSKSSGSEIVIRYSTVSFEEEAKGSNLASCQLPAMIRPRSESGHFGCWKGAVIVKHGPDRLILQVADNSVVPDQVELMFSPIGAEGAHSAGRKYNDDGSVIGGSDVRSKRIRVRAITKNVLASNVEGTVLLVMDVARTLYRTA